MKLDYWETFTLSSENDVLLYCRFFQPVSIKEIFWTLALLFATDFKRPISLTNYSEMEQFLSLLPKILFLASMPEASHSCRLPDTSFIFRVQSFLALLKELLT